MTAYDALVAAVSDRSGCCLAVTPDVLRAYLSAHGWTRGKCFVGQHDLRHEVWRHTGTASVMVPDPSASDYVSRVWDVAQGVGEAEGRNPTLVLADWGMG